MNPKITLFIVFGLILLTLLLVSPIPKCKAQLTGLTITYDEYGWTSGMKQVSMTTPDRGLIFAITIYNNSTKPFDTNQGGYYYNTNNNLYIFITVKSDDTPQQNGFSDTLIFDSNNGGLYLPPHESIVRYVRVADSMGNNLTIGSYSAELSYSNNQYSSGSQATPIGTYPFNFKVETESTLQQAIQQSKSNSGIIINIGPINLTLIDLGGILTVVILSGAGITGYLRRKKRKR